MHLQVWITDSRAPVLCEVSHLGSCMWGRDNIPLRIQINPSPPKTVNDRKNGWKVHIGKCFVPRERIQVYGKEYSTLGFAFV